MYGSTTKGDVVKRSDCILVFGSTTKGDVKSLDCTMIDYVCTCTLHTYIKVIPIIKLYILCIYIRYSGGTAAIQTVHMEIQYIATNEVLSTLSSALQERM